MPVGRNVAIIRNPLTIIGVFATLAEICGTVVLPDLNPEMQAIYVWFVMGFPVLLVVLFFLTLWFKHHTLYAPGDYKDEENFLRGLKRATSAEKNEKLDAELAELEKAEDEEPGDARIEPVVLGLAKEHDVPSDHQKAYVRRRMKAQRVRAAEHLALTYLEQALNVQMERDLRLRSHGSVRILDGVAEVGGQLVAVEVKYVSSPESIKHVMNQSLQYLSSGVEALRGKTRGRVATVRQILCFVTNVDHDALAEVRTEAQRQASLISPSTEVRVLDFKSLSGNA